MQQVVLHVEQDDQAVVEALAPDAPLVHECQRVGVGCVEAVALRFDLRVDGYLGSGPNLNRIDRLLGLGDRPGREDARVVVDALTRDGSRVGWARRRRGQRRTGRGQEQEPHRRRCDAGDSQTLEMPHLDPPCFG